MVEHGHGWFNKLLCQVVEHQVFSETLGWNLIVCLYGVGRHGLVASAALEIPLDPAKLGVRGRDAGNRR